MIGLTAPDSKSGHTFALTAAATAPFSWTDRARSVEPVSVSRLRAAASYRVALRPALQPDLHEPAFDREHVDIARHVVAADHVEDDVDAASAGRVADGRDEIRLAIVDRALGAEPFAGRAFLREPAVANTREPRRVRQLNRDRADPARAAVNQNPLARLRAVRARTRWSRR